MELPVLRTARLVLRRLEPSDAAAIHVARGDPEVCRYWEKPASAEVAPPDERGRSGAWLAAASLLLGIVGLSLELRAARRGEASG